VSKPQRITGRIPALECLRVRKRRARRLFLLADGKGLDPVRTAATAAAIPIEECDRRRLDQLAGGEMHQGVVLEAEPLAVITPEDWLAQPLPDDAIVVVLDGIVDPHNFGAIVRSAVAFGAAGIVFAQDRSAPISSVAVKSAAGAMEHADLVCAPNLVRVLQKLKDAGFWVAGLDLEGAEPLWGAKLGGKIAIVVGSEGKGMRRLVREHCDFRIHIPATGPIGVLNASASAAVALAECARQRQG
jgi:23S rRNA (guanosine2251-2'-O)-methyltransferase